MSEAINIFIGYSGTLDALVQEIEPILGVAFVCVPDGADGYFDRYESSSGEHFLFVSTSEGFENDRDLRFTSYPYFLGLDRGRPSMTGDWAVWIQKWQNEARSLYQTLRATRRYPLLLVHEMQTRIDAYLPMPAEMYTVIR